MNERHRFVIIGAGLTGLSAAYHLGKDSIVLEKEDRPGGLCRTVEREGFSFDYTGHLLHLNNVYTRNLVQTLIGARLSEHRRRASIRFGDNLVPFPFQANLSHLPPEVTKECLLGFIKAYCDKGNKEHDTFSGWVLAHLGEGLARHFFIPYNEKLYGTDLRDMTPEWCDQFVPKPDLEETVDGALGMQKKDFGYNATFLYPSSGGIQTLPDALGGLVNNVRPNTQVTRIDWRNKALLASSGLRMNYSALVSTMPLPELLDSLDPFPEELRNARRALRGRSVLCVALGVEGPEPPDGHWIYFPEPGYVFYRVGFFHNFSPAMAPEGCFSLYAEIAGDSGLTPDIEKLVNRAIDDLCTAGVLRPGDRIKVVEPLYIPCAYVVYNKERPAALASINEFLRNCDIYPSGRYGEWKYSSMETSILDGLKTAEHLKRA